MENSQVRLSGIILAENQNIFIGGEIHIKYLGFFLSGIQENFGVNNKRMANYDGSIAYLYCVTNLTIVNGNYYFFPIYNLDKE